MNHCGAANLKHGLLKKKLFTCQTVLVFSVFTVTKRVMQNKEISESTYLVVDETTEEKCPKLISCSAQWVPTLLNRKKNKKNN